MENSTYAGLPLKKPFIRTMADIYDLSTEYDVYSNWKAQMKKERTLCQYVHSKNLYAHPHVHSIYKNKLYPVALNKILEFSDYIQFKKKKRYGCAYNHKKNLMVIRKMRVITLSVDTSGHIPTLLRECNISVVTSLIGRQAFQLDADYEFDYAINSKHNHKLSQPKSKRRSNLTQTPPHQKHYNNLSLGIRSIIDWLTEIIYGGMSVIHSYFC